MVSQLNPFEDQNQLGQQGLEGGDLSQRQADGSLEQGVGGAEDITRSLERVAAAEAWLSSLNWPVIYGFARSITWPFHGARGYAGSRTKPGTVHSRR